MKKLLALVLGTLSLLPAAAQIDFTETYVPEVRLSKSHLCGFASSAQTPALAPAENITFFEGFEGWDGTTPNWIPEGWTEINSDAELAAYNDGVFTWHVRTPATNTALPYPVEGTKYAIVYHANINKTEYPQDEWLITPVIRPKDGDVLSCQLGYSPLFLYDVRDENIDWGKSDFKKRVKATTMQILIKEVDAEEWTLLKDIFDDWKSETLKNLMNMLSSEFHPVEVNLTKYAGKEVQIAFRFVGYMGNTMELDAVKVASNTVTASYCLPSGTFYWGYSEDGKLYTNANRETPVLMPSHVNVTYENTSPEPATQFQWTYYTDPLNPYKESSQRRKNLIVKYANGDYLLPTLYATSSDGATGSFSWPNYFLRAGGTAQYLNPSDNNVIQFGLGNYDVNKGLTVWRTLAGPIFGHYEGIDAYWQALFNIPTAHLSALGNRFDAPLRPYVVTRLWIFATGQLDEDAELRVKLYKLDANGAPTEQVLATGTCAACDVKNVGGNICLPFSLTSTEGLFSEVVIDGACVVKLEGFDEGGVSAFGLLQTNKPDLVGQQANGVFWLTYTEDDQQYEGFADLASIPTDAGEPAYCSFAFNLDATYPWLQSMVSSCQLPAEGTPVEIEFDSYYAPSQWFCTAAEASGRRVSWLKTKVVGEKLQVSAEPYEGTEGVRTCFLTVAVPGAEKVIEVTQTATPDAIHAVTRSDVPTRVWVKDGNFYVIGHAADASGFLYNAAGQLVKAFSLSGTDAIPASHLPAGAYVIRLDSGTSFKVVK